LKYFDGDTINILRLKNSFPTSLGPHEQSKFIYDHNFIRKRPAGAAFLECCFTMEDDEDNIYNCIAKKDISNCYDVECALGMWETTVYNDKDKERTEKTIMRTKIFISHRGMDKEYAEAFVDFLEDLGVNSKDIVCTSVPNHLIPNGAKIYDWLREQFVTYKLHMFFLLSDNYYKSPDCLNEMGAAWVTRADSDVVLLPGFSPSKIQGCIGTDTMAIYFDGDNDILFDRIKQLRDKVCYEFGLNIPDERRWNNVRLKLIRTIRSRESKTDKEADLRQPEFDVKITAVNKQLPNLVEVVDIRHQGTIEKPKHKNIQIQVELCNDVIIRNLKVFGKNIDTMARKNNPYSIAVCYLESPDAANRNHVWVLTRDRYPAGENGYPRILTIEYNIDDRKYIQTFELNDDYQYMPSKLEMVKNKDVEKITNIKQKMYGSFYRPSEELQNYTAEQLKDDPSLKLIHSKTIIMSKECQDPKWNTDGRYGEYEMFDLCDEGLLLWDYTTSSVMVTYYQGGKLKTTKANSLWCLLYDDIIAFDMDGNDSYNEPIIYTEEEKEKSRFKKVYYWDSESKRLLDNAMIVEVQE